MGSQSETYEIVTATLPDELTVLQDVISRSFGAKSLTGALLGDQKSPELEAFSAGVRAIRQQNALEGRNNDGMRSVVGKAVHIPSGAIVGVVIALAPVALSEQHSLLPPLPPTKEGQVIPEGGQTVLDIWDTMNQQTLVRSIELMGDARNRDWWYLSALGVVPEHQAHGLGGRLVKWIIEQARMDVEDCRNRRSAGIAESDARQIKGIWVIAAEAALKLYMKHGMKFIGEGWLGEMGDDNESSKETGKARLFTWLKLEM